MKQINNLVIPEDAPCLAHLAPGSPSLCPSYARSSRRIEMPTADTCHGDTPGRETFVFTHNPANHAQNNSRDHVIFFFMVIFPNPAFLLICMLPPHLFLFFLLNLFPLYVLWPQCLQLIYPCPTQCQGKPSHGHFTHYAVLYFHM